MILKHKETGMVIVAVKLERWSESDKRLFVFGVVREPGRTRFVVGASLAVPYDAGEWEEVGE